MGGIRIFRHRYIPLETVELVGDEILLNNGDVMVTKWTVLKPRSDFSNGYSCYFLKEGYKISKFLDAGGGLVYYYCDIIDVEYDSSANAYTFNDLLADVIIYNDGRVRVVDIGEIADAMESGLITPELAQKALRRLDRLLELIYTGKALSMVKDYF